MSSNFTQSEDCLYLNIYVPVGASALNQKSVMVWIHGGGYIFGDGTRYDGSFLSGIGDVIVVTLNYRLNAFGFLISGSTLHYYTLK
jgi:carboxylesterase type B